MKVLDKVLKEVVVVAGLLVAGGEAAVTILPPGPLQTLLTVLIPVVGAIIARQHTISLSNVEALIAALLKRKAGHPMADLTALNQAIADAQAAAVANANELEKLKAVAASATPQDQVDAATAAVRALEASLHVAATPDPPA